MAGRILLAAVLSAVLMFMWGFVYWGLLDMGSRVMKPLPAELDVLAALRLSQAESGMYLYPASPESRNEKAMAALEKQFEEGPILQMAYRADGGPMMPPSKFAQGLAHYFAVALLTAGLVALASRSLPSYGSRVLFVLLVSLLSAVWSNVGDAVWWFHSPSYCLSNMAYTLGAGLLMAFVVAAMVKSPGEAET